MSTIDKNQAVIDFLLNCPQIRDNPLFFNAINAKDNNKEIITVSNEKTAQTPFIDGGIAKQFTFTIIDFRSVSYQAIVKQTGYVHENVEEMLDVQGIIDWVMEQDKAHIYPDFGSDCIIDSMTPTTDNPSLNSIDNSASPALAKYSMSIKIEYIDNTNKIGHE